MKQMNDNPGRALERLRPTCSYTCVVCGLEFLARRPARFCGNRCKQADKYARRVKAGQIRDKSEQA